jgi:hypothetical protein
VWLRESRLELHISPHDVMEIVVEPGNFAAVVTQLVGFGPDLVIALADGMRVDVHVRRDGDGVVVFLSDVRPPLETDVPRMAVDLAVLEDSRRVHVPGIVAFAFVSLAMFGVLAAAVGVLPAAVTGGALFGMMGLYAVRMRRPRATLPKATARQLR